MKILSVLNQKGGSCKTTATTNIAVECARRGRRVLIVDTDRQHSAMDWRAMRAAENVVVVSMTKAHSLAADVRDLGAPYDLVIIDGEPNISTMTAVSIKIADAILIPIQPTPRDLLGVNAIVDLIKERHSMTDGLPLTAFLVARTSASTKLSREIDVCLGALGFPVLDARIHNRQAYPSAELTGQGVVEADPAGRGAQEIVAIVDELIEHHFI